MCLSPPYDQFTSGTVARLEAQSPYNIARIVKAPKISPDETGARYEEAKSFLETWVAQRALTCDAAPGVYPYSQAYSVAGERLTRHGFIALGDLRDTAIRPHEETHRHIRDDRARLRRATAADFGLVFMVYSDPSQGIDRFLRDCEATAPLLIAEQPDGSLHRLYGCSDPKRIDGIIKTMSAFDCVIADGHHRTAAAFDTWQQARDERWAFTMMAFFNAEAPGMTVMPIHRAVHLSEASRRDPLLERFSGHFDVRRYPIVERDAGGIAAQMQGLVRERGKSGRGAIAMVVRDDSAIILLETPADTANWRWPKETSTTGRTLPTAIFETGVLRGVLQFEEHLIEAGERVEFLKDASAVVESVRSGHNQLGFVLSPTPLDAIFEMARLRENMPQKSTFFFPKLLTGLTVHRIGTTAGD